MTVTLIAAVASNGVIGRDNDLVWRNRDDLARFKRLTLGHTLVMGRKTYDSIGRPLPGRTTIVITRQPTWSAPGVTTAHSLEEALKLATSSSDSDQIFIAGGAEIYRLALPYADHLELTHIHTALPGDTYFPPIDPTTWKPVAQEPGEGFTWTTYTRTP